MASSGWAATAPATIGGMVFREQGAFTGSRSYWARTILFGADGRYSFLTAINGSTGTGAVGLATPPPDGSYTYAKTSASTATVTFSEAAANAIYGGPLRLEFTDERTVGDAPGGLYSFGTGARGGTFAFTPLRREALANISLRGSVEPGRALIAGFVVKEERREVLLRVVGPSLAQFGVAGVWADPRFEVYGEGSPRPSWGGDGPSRYQPYYRDWSPGEDTAAALRKVFSYTGAFPLQAGSKDAVSVAYVGPGAYTVVCSVPPGEVGGEALIEVYLLP